MRSLIGATAASVLVAGALMGSVGTAARADDGGAHVFQMGEAGAGQSGRAAGAPKYMQLDARDAKAAAGVNVDNDNVYYNHAQGTMAANPSAAPAAQDQSGRYTASYSPYLQVEARDLKAGDAGKDVDGANIYFNHAKGTMSGN